MKKWFLLSIMLGAFALPNVAQDDDMYFVPTKRQASSRAEVVPSSTYYSGSSRSVDDYNRRWASSYEVLPTDTSDVISFSGVEGVYPDSLGDFALTQRMARWDGYEPSTAYWEGYAQGRRDYIGWHSPWYYSSYYPWYDSWYWDSWYYDPWYYRSWYYDPWYYGGWGWGGYYSSYYYPRYYSWGGGGHIAHRSWPGTQNHGRIIGASPRTFASGRGSGFGGTRNGRGAVSTRSGSTGFGGSGAFSGSRSGSFGSTSTRTRTNVGTYNSGNTGFNGSRSTQSSGSFSGSRSTSSSSSSSSSGSFGGSRGGSSGGGARSGGGGGFGGSRRR